MYDSCVYVSTVHVSPVHGEVADARSWLVNKAREGPCLGTDATCLLGTDYFPTGCRLCL